MTPIFQITERHYNTIVKQAMDNFPQEAGGFLGGKHPVVQAILPVFNQHLGNRTDTFSITQEDIERAHLFFKKHGMTYFGVYHSHPKGVPYPSKGDIKTGQRYHFIVGLKNQSSPDFRAYEIIKNEPVAIPLQIVSDSQFSVADLHGPGGTSETQSNRPQNMMEEASELADRIGEILEEKPSYKKMDPKNPFESDFSTLA